MGKKNKQKSQSKSRNYIKEAPQELHPDFHGAKFEFVFDNKLMAIEFDSHEFAHKTVFEILEPLNAAMWLGRK